MAQKQQSQWTAALSSTQAKMVSNVSVILILSFHSVTGREFCRCGPVAKKLLSPSHMCS